MAILFTVVPLGCGERSTHPPPKSGLGVSAGDLESAGAREGLRLRGVSVIPDLMRLSDVVSRDTRYAISDIIGGMGAEAVPLMIRELKGPEASQERTSVAISSLVKIGLPSVVPLLNLECLGDLDQRANAGHALLTLAGRADVEARRKASAGSARVALLLLAAYGGRGDEATIAGLREERVRADSETIMAIDCVLQRR